LNLLTFPPNAAFQIAKQEPLTLIPKTNHSERPMLPEHVLLCTNRYAITTTALISHKAAFSAPTANISQRICSDWQSVYHR